MGKLKFIAFQHAGDTVGDELPYGWDEAETPDGETYYIDHNTEVSGGSGVRLLAAENHVSLPPLCSFTDNPLAAPTTAAGPEARAIRAAPSGG